MGSSGNAEYMGPVYSKLDQTWRMQLQPIVEVSEEVLVDEVVVVTVAVAVVVAVEAAVARRRRSGYLQLNLAVSSKRAKSSRLRRFIFSHYLSKSSRLLIISSGQRSRMRCWRSCRSRNRRALVSVPDSKRLSPSVTTMAMLGWASSAVKRWLPLFVVPLSWRSYRLCLCTEDCYTSARGSTGTLGNFAKATYAAIGKTYSFLTPDLWKETVSQKSPYQEHTAFLSKNHNPLGFQRQEQKQY